MDKEVEQIKSDLRKKITKKPIPTKDLLSCGSNLGNCACTDRASGAFPIGTYILLVGDSESGKTFLAATTLAEAANNPVFDGYDLIFDNVEKGLLMDTIKFYGKKLADRLNAPNYDKHGEPIYSETVEDFGDTLAKLIAKGTPFVLIEDSLDALTCRNEQKVAKKQRKAHEEGEKVSGSYGTDKAKAIRQILRLNLPGITKLGAIVIILCQTTTNIGWGSMYEKKTRGGGTAPRYFATLELWTSIRRNITRTIRGRKVQTGILVQLKVRKNRVTGKHRSVTFPIFYDFGIDDIGSSINYLVEWKHWTKSKSGEIDAMELGECLNRTDLISYIENENLEKKLQSIVGKTWREIESQISVQRKARYK